MTIAAFVVVGLALAAIVVIVVMRDDKPADELGAWSAANAEMARALTILVTQLQADQRHLLDAVIALSGPQPARSAALMGQMRTLAQTQPRIVEDLLRETTTKDPEMYAEDGQVMVPVGLDQ